MKLIKFKDLKAYFMYYWPEKDSLFFVEYKCPLDKDIRFKFDINHPQPREIYAGEFMELGEL